MGGSFSAKVQVAQGVTSMAIEITYSNLDYPDGKKFSLPNLGVVENNKPTVLSDEQVENFRKLEGRTVHQAYGKRKAFTVRTVNDSAGGEK